MFAWHRKVLTCIANWSRTVPESFKHGILFFVRQKSSQNNRQVITCVPNPSPTLCKRLQTHRKLVSAICTCYKYAIQMRLDCDINKTISRLNCEKIKLIEIRVNVVRHSRECSTTVVRCTHECLETVVRHSREIVRVSSI